MCPQIQIFPMSDDYLSTGQSIRQFFTEDLVQASAHRPVRGRFNFKSQGVTAPPGSLLLFQYKSRLVAHAVLRGQYPPDKVSPVAPRASSCSTWKASGSIGIGSWRASSMVCGPT